MKMIVLSIFLASMFSMCGHEADLETQHTEVIHEEEPELALNGTGRWQADAPTNRHIRQLQFMLKEFSIQAENNTADAYNDLGRSMQKELQQLFKDCSMKGPDHDMLHVYLVPLVEDVKLLEGKDERVSESALVRISAQLKKYSTYFE